MKPDLKLLPAPIAANAPWEEFELARVEVKPRSRKSCTARCERTGKRCMLPEHSDKEAHANGRYRFFVTAAPGQTRFDLAELRDELAVSRGLDVTTLLQRSAS